MSDTDIRKTFRVSFEDSDKPGGCVVLLGHSEAFLRAMRQLHRFARTDANIMLYGETGTGKELAARALHYLGPRQSGPFVPVNCGALPDNLVENELFGHVRGAFTDARGSHSGLIAGADGGSLFLDEIECLSMKGQVALLRFLQDRRYRPLGAAGEIEADVRVVAASNQDLPRLVREGRFREDLLYRLAIMAVDLPPLRERGNDVLLLAEHFIKRFSDQYQTDKKRLDRQSAEQALAYHWPGNVRELENFIHREFLLAEDGVMHFELRPGGVAQSNSLASDCVSDSDMLPEDACEVDMKSAKAAVIERFERGYLEKMIAETQGNVSLAAQRAGKERRAFGKLLKKYGIDRSCYC